MAGTAMPLETLSVIERTFSMNIVMESPVRLDM